MSVIIMSAVLRHAVPDMVTDHNKDPNKDPKKISAATATLVLIALAEHSGPDGEHIFPSIDRLMEFTKLSRPTVVNTLNALRKAEYLEYVGISKRGTSEYKLNLTKLGISDDSKPTLLPVNTDLNHSKPSLPEPRTKPSLKDNSENEKTILAPPPKPGRIITNALKYSIAVSISEVCNVSYKAMQGRLFKVAKEIAQDERVTPELIRKVFSKGGVWYSQDWRGQKGQPPGIGDIAENLFKWDISEVNVIHGGLKDRPVKEKGGLKVNG